MGFCSELRVGATPVASNMSQVGEPGPFTVIRTTPGDDSSSTQRYSHLSRHGWWERPFSKKQTN
jgi:hypothetical protein